MEDFILAYSLVLHYLKLRVIHFRTVDEHGIKAWRVDSALDVLIHLIPKFLIHC